MAGKRASESIMFHMLSVKEHLESITEVVNEHMSETQQKQKVRYDQSDWMRELKPNDQVLVLLLTTHNKLLIK